MTAIVQKPDMSTLTPTVAALLSAHIDRRLGNGLAVEFFYPDVMARTGKPFLAYASSEAVRDRWMASARKKGVVCNAVYA